MEILGDSKVTDKFQATIPRAVRHFLRLDSGDRLVFTMESDRIVLRKGRLDVQT